MKPDACYLGADPVILCDSGVIELCLIVDKLRTFCKRSGALELCQEAFVCRDAPPVRLDLVNLEEIFVTKYFGSMCLDLL